MVPTQRKSRQGGFGCLPLVVLVMDRQRASLGSPQALKQSRPPCPTPAPTLAWSVPPALPCLALPWAWLGARLPTLGVARVPSHPSRSFQKWVDILAPSWRLIAPVGCCLHRWPHTL